MGNVKLILLNTTALESYIIKGLTHFCYTTMSKFWQGVGEMSAKLIKSFF
jgi:hypothetical protein